MARGKQTLSLTSISEAKAVAFLKSADVGKSLFCKNIPGFHLIQQSGGGVWRYRYTDASGKRRVATVGKFALLKPENAAEKVRNWIESGIDPLEEKAIRRHSALRAVIDKERRTLRYYLENYYKPHMERSWKPQNAANTYGRIKGQFAELLDRDMATFDKADIDQWQRQAEKKGRAYSTIRRSYGALKTLLRRAVKDQILEADPLANHSLLEPTLKDQTAARADPGKAERRLLTNDEIQAIHNGLALFAEEIRQQRRNSREHGKPGLPDLDKVNHPHWFIPFCHLALHTGLRPGDLYSLNWQELNIPFARLTKVCEKTAHAARRERKPAVVDMKLNPTIRSIMADWHKDNDSPQDGLVFPSPKKGFRGLQMDGQAHRRPWNRVKELGGLPENLNFYCFRHHFISALLAAGVPIFTVAKLAGHKGVEMILQHYGHLCPDQATEALDIVARAVRGQKENSRKSE